MSGRGGDRPLPAARRPPVRIARGGGRTTLRTDRAKSARGDGGGGSSDGPGGGASGWFLVALLAVAGLLGASAAWRWWGPGAGHQAATAGVDRDSGREAGFVTGPPRRPIDAPRRPSAAAVRVEILNGSGEPGAAAKLASYLRQGGFNVVVVGSADRYDYLRTLVVARTDDDRPSRDVSRYLGDVDRVTQRARSEADVTVVVGKDRGRSPWGEGRDPNARG